MRRQWSIDLLHRCVDIGAREITADVERAGADLVGFSCYSWNIREVKQVVHGLAGTRKPIIVLGGVEVTPDPAKVMLGCRAVDVIVFGEGEATFCALLGRLGEDAQAVSRGRLGDVEGIAWRCGRSVHVNDPRPPIGDLSTIPSPYLSGAFGDSVRNVRTAPLETVRGCPYHCAYCFEARGFKTMRAFPLERVKEEIRHLVRMGVEEIEFYDTNLNFDRERALALIRFLRTLGRRISYWFELRAELLDGELTRALGALHFFGEVGLQTTNPPALKAIRRTLNRRRFEAGVRALLEASIFRPCAYSRRLGIAIDVMAGLPHDSVSDVLETFDFAFRLAPSKIMLAMTKILPGTELHEKAATFQYRFDASDDHMIRSSSTLSSEEVKHLVHFSYAVYAAYNNLHAVRTTGWMAGQLGIRPSRLFLELGRRMAVTGVAWKSLTVADLAELLAEIGRDRGNRLAARKVASKLGAETILNLLQSIREKRRTRWSRWLFTIGYRALSFLGWLAPLPGPSSGEARGVRARASGPPRLARSRVRATRA